MTQQNALTVIGGMKISTVAKQSKYADQELGAGIAAPFAVIGYKGGRWSIRHRGNTHVLERRDAQGRPDGFVPYLDLVVLLAASHHSKVYYAKNYTDGDDSIPDCWSTDGVKPDQAAPHKQSPICANCKWNEFGSRVNQATGSKGKACADTRRMAVVPYADLENSMLGGPMLLRVPPASLGSVGEYSDMLKASAVPYSAIATRVGFDPKEAYPKMIFQPLAALTDDEMRTVIKMQEHTLVERIVQEQIENVVAQVGSEQGTNVAADAPAQAADAPPAANGQHGQPATPAATPDKVNPFATVPTGGPSYQGKTAPTEPVGRPAVETQPTAQTAPAVTPAPQESLTPEQARIRELEALLATTQAKPGRAPTRRRTQPVAPQTDAQPHTPQQEAAPAEAAEEDGSGSGMAQPETSDPALDTISARLAKILS
jgi:hypothetical protein